MIRKKPAKKPATKTSAKEAKAQKFIQGAEPAANGTGSRLQPVMIKIDRTVLASIDKQASAMGLTRSAYMIAASTQMFNALKSQAARAKLIIAAHKNKANGKE
jgi:hypothetical protein